jgi:bifunctional NMN adenylyltransferase/nudix hydrolase
MMDTPVSTDVAVVIGRFQPFHHGHAMLLRLALDTAPQVVVVLGSSFHARSPRNPFTWQERAEMISASLSAQDKSRVCYVAVRDYYEDARWAGAVRAQVRHAVSGAAHIALVGYFKDGSSYYLNRFPQWRLVTCNDAPDIDATRIRKGLFEAENIDASLTAVAEQIPMEVCQYLKTWSLMGCFPGLAREHAAIEAYKESWQAAPYPPIFTTVDAVVKTAGHVLLIQRAGFPGKGLWAIPGGFLEQRERLLQGAIRELCEETRLAVPGSSLVDGVVEVKVFDHPDRSLRGRTITHAHFFELESEHLPIVEASDDAAHAVWIPIGRLAGMEEEFYEDHFHILDHFLELTED